MTDDKRFTLREPRIDNDLDCSEIADNGQWITYGEIVDMLNELHEENQRLKKQLQTEHQQLENAILLERTRMGKNSLKQYKEAIQ